jgi:hypothetical protein
MIEIIKKNYGYLYLSIMTFLSIITACYLFVMKLFIPSDVKEIMLMFNTQIGTLWNDAFISPLTWFFTSMFLLLMGYIVIYLFLSTPRSKIIAFVALTVLLVILALLTILHNSISIDNAHRMLNQLNQEN